MVATTAPLLAVTSGIDAFNSALNLLAILFVLDADDLIYSAFFAKHQRAAIEAIELNVPAGDQQRLDAVALFALLSTLLSTLGTVLIVVIISGNAELSESWNTLVMNFCAFFFPSANSFFTCAAMFPVHCPSHLTLVTCG